MAEDGTGTEQIAEAGLDEQFEDGIVDEGDDFGGEPSMPDGTGMEPDGSGMEPPSGIEEALQAWEAGGHSIDEEEEDEARPVHFAQLDIPAQGKPKSKPSRLNNVYVDITVELGRKEMSVRELTNLKEQDVVDLDKLAGEAFDILINERQFAEGEIVVVTDLMAVRITRLLEPKGSEEEEE